MVQPTYVRRFWALVLSLFLGYCFVVQPAHLLWEHYWLLKDGQPGIATVTQVLLTGHGAVAYQYRVDQAEFTGTDAVRGYNHGRGDTYPPAVVGQHLPLYFSVSHPWVSRLERPTGMVPVGLPLFLGVWALEALLIWTVINPNSRWALRIGGRKFFNRD
jgi:hypothetical protein